MTSPQWLDREAASTHLRMTRKPFNPAVRGSKLPPPSNSLGLRSECWRVTDLDSFMSGNASCGGLDMNGIIHAIDQKLQAKARKGRKVHAG